MRAAGLKSFIVGSAVLGAVAFGASVGEAASTAADGEGTQTVAAIGRKSVSISNNGGGYVVQFALKVAEYRDAGTLVKFSGRCDSSCTLFLSLPENQICLNPGAYFRFHAPSGPNARAIRVAQSFMMNKYPGWVRNWIHQQGGLSKRLIKMDSAYAGRFVASCETVALR
jgi:hypothetical protein